ncbi:hypothetical protein EIP86_001327 [Pleurotus ostreatoroseus]|nr:hypothetical protein EIP86_001327 [Pleurotus ostreatoroseus]
MSAFKKAFNGQVDIADAMKWTNVNNREGTDQMLDLFDKIKANPATYGMQVKARDNVSAVVDKIRDMIDNYQVFMDSPLQAYYQDKSFDHYTVFDLIGWLFSVCGDSPSEASRSNYYYPLSALFSVFSRLAASDGNDEPQMVQVTWFTQTVGQSAITRAVVGANLDDNAGEHRDEKDSTRTARAQMFVDVGLLDQSKIDDSLVKAPSASGSGPKRRAFAQLYGHCAETYPFLYLQSVQSQIPQLQAAAGLALRTTDLLPSNSSIPLDYAEADVIAAITNPCANCTDLIQKLKLNYDNFKKPS